MFDAEIKDLESLKSYVLEAKSEASKPDTSQGTIKNTPQFQAVLDLLVNMPLSGPVNSNEIYQLQNQSIWIQSFRKGSKRKLLQCTHVPQRNLENMYGIYDLDYINDKYYLIDYNKFIDGDSVGNIRYLTKSELGSGATKPYNFMKYSSILGNLYYLNTLCLVNSTYSKFFPVEPSEILDHNNYNVFQMPTSKLNYYISKNPFIIKTSEDSTVNAMSQFNFPDGNKYDVLIYPDRLVYIAGGGINDTVDYKTFKIPELTPLESGRDKKVDVYSKLKLNRQDIVGPNILQDVLNSSAPKKACEVQYGFRYYCGQIFDVYMNNLRVHERAFLKYRRFRYFDEFVLCYY